MVVVVRHAAPETVTLDRRQFAAVVRAAQASVEQVRMALMDDLPTEVTPQEYLDTAAAVREATRLLTERAA